MLSLKNKKVLVTGGFGFIGSHLSERLLDFGAKVYVVDNLFNGKISNIPINNRKKIKFIKIDISKKKILNLKISNIFAIFHLAALADIVPSINAPIRYYQVNVNGTLNILEFAKKNKVKKIFYSASSTCYGIPKKYPTPENYKIDTKYPYANSKYIGEQIIQHFCSVYKINFISLRLFNVYGPRSRTSGTYGAVFGVFLAQKLNNKPLTVVGSGNQKRDFTYVSDVVDAFIIALRKEVKNHIINIGSGGCYSINYLVKLLNGKKIHIPKRPGEPDKTYADISKAKKILNWYPKVSFEEGVKKMLLNINSWTKAPLWNKTSIKKETKDWFSLLK